MTSCRHNTEININISLPLLSTSFCCLTIRSILIFASLCQNVHKSPDLTKIDNWLTSSWERCELCHSSAQTDWPGPAQLSTLGSTNVCQETQTFIDKHFINQTFINISFIKYNFSYFFSLFQYIPQIVGKHKDLIFAIRVSTKFEVLLKLVTSVLFVSSSNLG